MTQTNTEYSNTRDLYIPARSIISSYGQTLTTDWTMLGEIIKSQGMNKITLCMSYNKGTGLLFQYRIVAIDSLSNIYPFPYDSTEATAISHIPLYYYPKTDISQNIIREFRITPQFDHIIQVRQNTAGGKIDTALIALGMYK